MKALVSTRKGLFTLTPKKSSWHIEKHHFPGVTAHIAAVNPFDKSLWVGLNHGHWGPKLHVSRDGGQTFPERPTPQFPGEGDEKLVNFWSFSFDSKGIAYAGVEPANLFTTENEGETWHMNQAFHDLNGRENWFAGASEKPCLHSILPHPSNPDSLTLGVSVGGVIGTDNGGQSFRYHSKGMKAYFLPDEDAEIGQDPHIVKRAPSNPQILWQQNHCGIFKSTDGGVSWLDLSQKPGVYSRFGWALWIHNQDPQTVFTIPAQSDECRIPKEGRLVVQKTQDGGETWSQLSKGLPQEHCFDITYRSAFDGWDDLLLFGTTNGNLYSSFDGGQQWSQDFSSLPPIYAVSLLA